jgi:hypothetical protein
VRHVQSRRKDRRSSPQNLEHSKRRDRITSIPSTYEDVIIGEPAAFFSGFAGVEHAIKAVQAQMPGMDLAVTDPIQTTGDMSTYTWALVGKDGNPVVKSRDVITVKHERIISRYVFFDT